MTAGIHASCLEAQSLAGPFSLIGQGPLQVEASPGLVVHVQAGSLAISRAYDAREYFVRAGKHFIAERAGPMAMEPLGRTELRLEWPADNDRLSPGLEPLGVEVTSRSPMEPFSLHARLGR